MTGRLGNNVELRKTQAQQDLATFRLATNRRYFRNGEWVSAPTTWITVKCFRQFATNVGMSLRKGQAVVVVGRLEVEEWRTQSGEDRQSLVLHAHAIGHDLNWGVTTMHKLERRVEPAPAEDLETEPDYQQSAEDELTASSSAELEEDHLASAEAFVARIATPVGSY